MKRHFDLKRPNLERDVTEVEAEEAERRRHVVTKRNYRSVVEQLIQEAQERGDFDNLRGEGKPLAIDSNPHAGEMELAYKLLKDNDFTLPWISARNRVLKEIEAFREKMDRKWRLFGPQVIAMAHAGDAATAQRRWAALMIQWETEISELNKRIDDVNHLVPVKSIEIYKVSLPIELSRVGATEDVAEMQTMFEATGD